ncbi:unnamed protein product [Lepeophtheirus salmonis]|uniref:(salmon louse) hypothetical protein n=1 Tax=Lepeophtheirus salmonis TaxID=72036 RepID=A0A7R8HCS3_LEPSM|nr:unnamed protein product [Lepeophtheirus salmonis]CAF3007526.1 unnamed protein product [Lepeophtheirus salmonis]
MILLYCLLLTLWSPTRGSEECPAGCYCHPLKNVPVPDAMLPFGHTIALKVNCHALADPEALDFSNLPENTIHLDLAKYGLKAIDKNDFVAVPWLEKLDLQGNQISSIQEGSFIRLKYLEILDLSRNNLRVISPDMFDGKSLY